MRLRRWLPALTAVAAALAVTLDRLAWAGIAQWREDPATNIWLGYTRGPLQVPVGLVTSVSLPNPNGLVLVSEFLSRLPNLWWVSAVLTLLQAATLAWMCRLAFDDRRLFLVAVGPLLSSIILRSASIDLHLHWILIPVNSLFYAGLFIYMKQRTPWMLPLFTALALLAASIYVAGAVNSLVYAILALTVFIITPGRLPWKSWFGPVLVSLGIVILSVWLTWVPYLREMRLAGLQQAASYSGLDLAERLQAAVEALLKLPLWTLAQYVTYGGQGVEPPYQISGEMQSAGSLAAYQWGIRLLLWQATLCYLSVIGAVVLIIRQSRPLREVISPGTGSVRPALAFFAAFVVLASTLSPLLGAAPWVWGLRLDEALQLVPFLLVLWFALPPALQLPPPLQKAITVLTIATSFAFTALGFVTGLAIVRDNFTYSGPPARVNVPIAYKLQAVSFIAQDWMSRSSSTVIPVDYALQGRYWKWVPEFGLKYLQWYPAPYTLGREFDYSLLREYGLSNAQEGVQLRTFGSGRYLLTHASYPPPVVEGHPTHEAYFGRLRVTIVEDR